jgi:hypothetical protein
MYDFMFLLLCSFLSGFSAGIFGSIFHQYWQRSSDKKRWNELERLVENWEKSEKSEKILKGE